MCTTQGKKTGQPPPTVIDGTSAAREEMAVRRKRSGTAFKSGRMGDTRQPSLMSKALFGQ